MDNGKTELLTSTPISFILLNTHLMAQLTSSLTLEDLEELDGFDVDDLAQSTNLSHEELMKIFGDGR